MSNPYAPDDCPFNSDDEFYQHSGPVLPACDACGWDIPRDTGHGCSQPNCRKMICSRCEPKQHAGEDWVYCTAHHVAALEQYAADLQEERDSLAASLVLTVASGNIGCAIEGLVASGVRVTCMDGMAASIEVERHRRKVA